VTDIIFLGNYLLLVIHIRLPELHWRESAGSKYRHINTIQHCLETSRESQTRASKWEIGSSSQKLPEKITSNKFWAIPINSFIRDWQSEVPCRGLCGCYTTH